MKNLWVLLLFIALLQSCYTTYISQPTVSSSEKYSDTYKSYLEEGSEMTDVGFYWMREQTSNGTTIYKQFYPSTKQITHFVTFRRGQKSGKYVEWYDNGNKWKEGEYGNDLMTGEWKYYSFPEGNLSEYGSYRMGKKTGEWIGLDSLGNKTSSHQYVGGELNGAYKIWNSKGVLTGEGRYENGELIESKFDEQEGVEVFTVVEEMPYLLSEDCELLVEYEARQKCGEKALIMHLYRNLKYPAIAREESLQGTALVQFVVEKDGSVSNINVMRGLCDEIKAECLKVVESMPTWHPGMQKGKPVRVQFTLPIKFKLG